MRTAIIPSYPYVQYNDDVNIEAFFSAYNQIAQTYLDGFNSLYLPVWTSATISGYLLDWVGTGLYGIPRPVLSSGSNVSLGPYNTVPFNQKEAYNQQSTQSSGTYYSTTDDIYKRILTWQLYSGDGKQFNLQWLKRRVARFLYGSAGTDPNLTNTYTISAVINASSHPGKDVVTITCPTIANVSLQLQAAIQQNIVNLPFGYTFYVTLV